MDIPLYTTNNDSTSSPEQDYNQQLNATLSENIGGLGFNITPITSEDLTTTTILNPNTGLPTTVMDLAQNGATWFVMDTNLGVVTILGSGVLAATELIVNGIDLAGTYSSAQSLADYINTGLIAGVTASVVGGNFYMVAANIVTVSTAGTVSSNGLTFSNFTLVNGPTSYSLIPKWIGKVSSNPTVLQQLITAPFP